MAEKRIIAYFMHEEEEAAASAAMSNIEATQSYLIGDVDERDIGALTQKGLIIEEVAAVPPAPLENLSEALATLSHYALDLDEAPDLLPGTNHLYTITLAGPLLPAWRLLLREEDVTLAEAVGPRRYLAELLPEQVARIRSLHFVTGCKALSQSEIAPPIPTVAAGPPVNREFVGIVTYDIRLRSEEDVPMVLARLPQGDVVVLGSKGRKIRIAIRENSPLIAQLQGMVEVRGIQEHVPPKLFNDRARALIGIDAPAPTPFPFDGRGQIVGVADTGIDETHPDFGGRLVGVIALGRPGDASDPNGHGTHVAGSIAGDGTASNGSIRGVAPAANIVFQSVLDAGGKLGGLPYDLNDLFDEAYQVGVRIHNNSWGASTSSRYAFNSLEADEFVDGHRDMTIVIAAGNEGTARQPFSSSTGFVDWLSIGSPATAKNAISVGASRTDRTKGGFAEMTWGQTWPDQFPDKPIADETISGDAESIAGFSSRGPCDDRRIKPDVVAPGTDIVSAKSSRAPLGNFWGSYPGHAGRYAFMGGTSMAAPIVSGCLASIRQYFVDVRNHEPSAALLKATLVNSTVRLGGSSSTADHDRLPNYHQGFGRVHMPLAVPTPLEPGLVLEYLDTWKEPARHLALTGSRLRFEVELGGARSLRICLAYTDIPGRALQNNLNLFVQSPDRKTKWTGNQDLPMRLSPLDSDNNVEIVRIETPQAGSYLIQVSAQNLLGEKPQDFALVVTGDLKGSIRDY